MKGVLLVLALFVAATFAQNSCQRPLTGTQFRGVLPNSGSRSPVLFPETRPYGYRDYPYSWAVQLTFGADGATMEERITNGTHTVVFETTIAFVEFNQLDYAEIVYNTVTSSVSPAVADQSIPVPVGDLDCNVLNENPGRYRIHWNDLCTRLTFELMDDHCLSRRVKYNGLAVRRVGSNCPLTRFPRGNPREQLLNAVYPTHNSRNELSGLVVQFVVKPGHSDRDTLEQSVRGTRRTNWKFTDDGHHLIVFDVSSRPKFIHCEEYGQQGIYLINWYDNCDRFVLTQISDSCQARSEIYNGLDIVRGGTEIAFSTNASGMMLPSVVLLLASIFLALF